MNLEQVRACLPAQIREIAEAIGLPATQRLVEELGGTTWPVARGVNRLGIMRHEALTEIVGPEAADIMAKRWGNVPLYIARCAEPLRRLRDLEIHRQFEQAVREGVSSTTVVNELARTYGLSDRRIWKILKQAPSLDMTGDLFH